MEEDKMNNNISNSESGMEWDERRNGNGNRNDTLPLQSYTYYQPIQPINIAHWWFGIRI